MSVSDIIQGQFPLTETDIHAAADALVQSRTQWKEDLRWLIECATASGINPDKIADILAAHTDDDSLPAVDRRLTLNIAKSYRLQQGIMEVLQPQSCAVDEFGDITKPGLYRLGERVEGSILFSPLGSGEQPGAETVETDLPTVVLAPLATPCDVAIRLTVHRGCPEHTRPVLQFLSRVLPEHGYQLQETEEAQTLLARPA